MDRKYLSYGWKPDPLDYRDYKYDAPARVLKNLPQQANLTNNCPEVYSQNQLGSCTATAVAGAFQFELMKQNLPVFMPSRLFMYNEPAVDDAVNEDTGAYLRESMLTITDLTACSEDRWPYTINEFIQETEEKRNKAALKNKTTNFYRVARNIKQMKACLAEGYPFVFGFTAYQHLESEEVKLTGQLNLPQMGEMFVGGHAVVAVGYDDETNRFIVRNSWGDDWGMKGYFTMPYEYVLNENLSDDFWTIRIVDNKPVYIE